MSQKSITSFFTKATAPTSSVPNPARTIVKNISPGGVETCETKNAAENDVDSPVKVVSRSKKRQWNRLQSDSEASEDEDKVNTTSAQECKTVEATSPLPKLRKTASVDPSIFGGKTLKPGIAKKIKERQEAAERERLAEIEANVVSSIVTAVERLKEEPSETTPICEEPTKTNLIESSDIIKGQIKNGFSKEETGKMDISTKKLKVDDETKTDPESNEKTDDIELDVENKKTSPVKKEVHSFFAPRKTGGESKKTEKKASPKAKKSVKEESTPDKKVTGLVGDREVDYDPSKAKYHPIDDACWNRGDNVPYLALARTLEEIEAISARLKIVEILSNYLRSVIVLSPDDLLPSIYLCLNKLAPAYEGVELGIAETTLMKAIAQSTGRSMAQIKSDTNSTGDLGIVAEQSRSNQRMMFQPAKLTVKTVYERLKDIAMMTGHAVMGKKVDKIQSMFVACRHSEARYLIRSLAGKLRIGLAEQSVLQAIGLACATTPPNQSYPHAVLNAAKGISAEAFKSRVDDASLIIKTTYCECPNYNKIVPVLLTEGVDALPNHCRLTPGVPLKPMLAHPTKGVHEVLHRFDGLKFTCEFKYDGERAQIHFDDDKAVTIYSRNQENNTTKYPDIVNRISKALGPNVTSFILDCEAVAWDKEKKQILPFQILSTRKRKDANESDIKVAVCVFMFDLLYLNGKPLVKETLVERRQLLKDNFIETEGEFIFATSIDTTTMDEVQIFLDDAIKGNCEGLMVKTLESDATYEIAKRSRNWLKLKKDYLEGVGDTLDVVVLGGYLGRGKRAGAYGGFLIACYDPENEEFQSLCKIGTGFSDESLQQHSEFFKEHVISTPRPYYRYDPSHEPDHWFDAVQVWEIKCADLSLSPVHRAAIGIVDPEKGISLRFPRYLRIRDDKKVEDATSSTQVAEFYNNQDQVKNQQTSTKATEEDFY